MNKYWKEAASIIIACKTNIFKPNQIGGADKKCGTDFKVLALKRGKTSSFFPGGYVFPGGKTEESDRSNEWLNLYETFGFKPEYFKKLISSAPQTPLFSSDSNFLHKSLALRITAIRETFEESGVLLCKSKKSLPSNWASYVASPRTQHWQKIVQNNSDEFINMCKELECFPDVWALHLWSNWLTPTTNPIRFDTAFFLTTVDQLPPSFVNYDEMDDIKWCTPNELLEGSNSTWLPPPQYYEMSRIAPFQSIEQLNNFAVQRVSHGCERWMPIMKQVKDGIITFLPGDDMYPEKVEFCVKDKMVVMEGTMENLRKNTHKMHRMELYGNEGTRIVASNIQPNDGHVLPKNFNAKL